MKQVLNGKPTKNIQETEAINIFVLKKLRLENNVREKAYPVWIVAKCITQTTLNKLPIIIYPSSQMLMRKFEIMYS